MLSGAEIALLSASVFGAGVLRGFTGFGGALAMAPVFGLVLGPTAALATIVMINVVTGWQMLAPSWRLMERKVVLSMTAAAVLAMPLGLAAVVMVEPVTVRRVTGVAVMGCALLLLLGWRRAGEARLPGMVAVGSIGGVLNGLAGIGGPPVALWLLSGRAGAVSARAGLIIYVAATQAATAAAAAVTGLIDQEVLVRTAWMAPLYVGGTWAGAWLFHRVPHGGLSAAMASTVLLLGVLAVAI